MDGKSALLFGVETKKEKHADSEVTTANLTKQRRFTLLISDTCAHVHMAYGHLRFTHRYSNTY